MAAGYQTVHDLPKSITEVLPIEAQELYLQAYNKALSQTPPNPGGGLTPESLAHRQAWAIMQREFVRDYEGKWRRKGEKIAPTKSERREGLFARIGKMFSRKGGHA